MNMDKLYFSQLRRSRKPLTAGDYFTLSIKGVGYFFGRVVVPSLPESHPHTDAATLICIYGIRSGEPQPSIEKLTPYSLLIPPLFTNRRPWTMGFFRNVGNSPLREGDVLGQHCFYDIAFNKYVDEMGNVLPGRAEPCGTFGVASYSGISSKIGDALGLPRLEGPEDY